MTENEFYNQEHLIKPQIQVDEIIESEFNYAGYQVVRGEYFAHIFEPSITFNLNKIYVNAACLKRLPDIDYVQILVNSEEKKLAIKPCSGEEKDSFLWCTPKRKPKQITGRVFFGKIINLMDWNESYRYKLIGKLVKSKDEYLFVFDLYSPEIFVRTIVEGEKPKTSRRPVFPEEWQNQFGLPVEEHKRRMQINTFDGYTVFGITDKKNNTESNDE